MFCTPSFCTVIPLYCAFLYRRPRAASLIAHAKKGGKGGKGGGGGGDDSEDDEKEKKGGKGGKGGGGGDEKKGGGKGGEVDLAKVERESKADAVRRG